MAPSDAGARASVDLEGLADRVSRDRGVQQGRATETGQNLHADRRLCRGDDVGVLSDTINLSSAARDECSKSLKSVKGQ